MALEELGVCPLQVGKQSRLMSDSSFGNREVKGQEMGWMASLAGKSDLLLLQYWPAFLEFSQAKRLFLVDHTLKRAGLELFLNFCLQDNTLTAKLTSSTKGQVDIV